MFISGAAPNYLAMLRTLPASTQARVARSWAEWKLLQLQKFGDAKRAELFGTLAQRLELTPLGMFDVYHAKLDFSHRALAVKSIYDGLPYLVWFWAGPERDYMEQTGFSKGRARSLVTLAKRAAAHHAAARQNWINSRHSQLSRSSACVQQKLRGLPKIK